MAPINDQAGRYHSPRGVDLFASVNAAIVALGGTPIEAPTYGRFARAPGGVQLLEALAELETAAGLEPVVVEQGRFFRSPSSRDTFDRLNAVVLALGGEAIDYGSNVAGAEVVALLEALATGAESGGAGDLSLLELDQAAAESLSIGALPNLGITVNVPEITIARAAVGFSPGVGKVIGAAGDARIQIPNVNRLAGGMAQLALVGWCVDFGAIAPPAGMGWQLWVFDGQPATVLEEGDDFVLSDADVDKLIALATLGTGSGVDQILADCVNQASTAASVVLNDLPITGRDVWAYLVGTTAWTTPIPASAEIRLHFWARYRS